MTIHEGFEHLIETSEYKNICKQKDGIGAKYRIYKGRFNKGTLHELAMVAMLLEHGYKITTEVPKKKKNKVIL